jgi:hypothetical protein
LQQALLGASETQNKIVNENQKALIGFSQVLEQHMAGVEDKAAVGTRTLRMLRGPDAQFAVAKDGLSRSSSTRKTVRCSRRSSLRRIAVREQGLPTRPVDGGIFRGLRANFQA